MTFSKYHSIGLSVFIMLACQPERAFSEVPVNDSGRQQKETKTRVCMERSRTYKQRAATVTDSVRESFASSGSTPTAAIAGTASVSGTAMSDTSIGGIDLSTIMGAAGAIAALKSRNAGEVMNAITATTLAISANQAAIKAQGQSIGSAANIDDAFDQNTAIRLSGASLWNQSVQVGTNTLKLRNQALADEAAAATKAARVWSTGTQKTIELPDNTTSEPSAPVGQNDVLNALEKLQSEAQQNDFQPYQ